MTHYEFTSEKETRGRTIFETHFKNYPLWQNSTFLPSENIYSNYDGIIQFKSNCSQNIIRENLNENCSQNIMIEIKCREKPEMEAKNDIWVPKYKVDWIVDNYQKENCFAFMVVFIEPIKKKMYIINRWNHNEWYSDRNYYYQTKNYPDKTLTKEICYSYQKNKLKQMEL